MYIQFVNCNSNEGFLDQANFTNCILEIDSMKASLLDQYEAISYEDVGVIVALRLLII